MFLQALDTSDYTPYRPVYRAFWRHLLRDFTHPRRTSDCPGERRGDTKACKHKA